MSVLLGFPTASLKSGRKLHMWPPPVPNREEYPFIGTIIFQGLQILVENAPGSTRSGVDPGGGPWSVKMRNYYGEIAGTQGMDGDPIDAYVGNEMDAPIAYVVHQKIPMSGEGGSGYDEDKVMLGFTSESEAIAAFRAHYPNHTREFEGGCTAIPVGDLYEKILFGDLSVAPMPITLAKSHPPAGFEPIPGGRHGGFRKLIRAGKYEYWYPDQAGHEAGRMEADPSKRPGTEDLQPGAVVEVGGRRGEHFRWTPDHGTSPEGLTWVTSMSSGAHSQVRASTVQGLRVAHAPEAKPHLPPPPPRKPTLPPPPPRQQGAIPAQWPKEPMRDTKTIHEPSPGARKAAVYAGSTAKPGTMLHKLEHGEYMLGKVRGKLDPRAHDAVVIPHGDENEMVREFDQLVAGAARKIAMRYRIPVGDRNGPTAAFEDLMSGAQLGFVMALQNYRGGGPFVPHAQAYARLYALYAAQTELGAGVAVPGRVMRVAAGYAAAQARARAKHGVTDPTPEQVAAVWTLRKKDVYTGESANLGVYMDAGGTHDQGDEEVPDGSWKIRTPNGDEKGKEQPGKLAVARKIEILLRGDKIEGDDVLADDPSHAALPGHLGYAMPAGLALHLREEADDLLDKLPQQHRVALEMRFGFSTEDGEPASLEAIADALGISQGKSVVSRRRDTLQLVDDATKRLKRLAEAKRTEVARYVERWAGKQGEPLFDPADPAFGASQHALEERFGSPERVHVYLAALRAGHADRTAAVLEAEKAGKASDSDSRREREAASAQIDRERLDAFRRHGETVTRDAVGDRRMTDPESDHLYTPLVEAGYYLARMKGSH